MKAGIGILIFTAFVIVIAALVGDPKPIEKPVPRMTDSALVHQLSIGRTPERVLEVVDSLLELQDARTPAQ